jgi:hypothetical protein
LAQTAVTKKEKAANGVFPAIPERYWLLPFNRVASPDARAIVLLPKGNES